MSGPPKIPKELDAIADVVLAYRPKPKSGAAKKRKKMAKKLASLEPPKVPPPRKNRAPY
jgi:hypothetical protein